MKLLVFAHIPPPHHGQSQMVQLMVNGFAKDDSGVEVRHVNCRLSRSHDDIGEINLRKLIRLLGYCLQAVRYRLRDRVKILYYVPAPPKRSALYRDWLVMLICRPFFKNLVLHWHAVGLGSWLENETTALERAISHVLLDRADLSIILGEAYRGDVDAFKPRRVEVVPNGIPDPLDGEPRCEPTQTHEDVNVLFLGHCMRTKGLFDAIKAVGLANERDQRRYHLKVCGRFMSPEEENEFQDLAGRQEHSVEHVGFVTGAAKESAFCWADYFVFPTYYDAEAQPLALLEAMAFGVPIITTRWRGIPDMLPANYPGIVDPQTPEQIAELLTAGTVAAHGRGLRQHFLDRFSVEAHIDHLAAAINAPHRLAGAETGPESASSPLTPPPTP